MDIPSTLYNYKFIVVPGLLGTPCGLAIAVEVGFDDEGKSITETKGPIQAATKAFEEIVAEGNLGVSTICVSSLMRDRNLYIGKIGKKRKKYDFQE